MPDKIANGVRQPVNPYEAPREIESAFRQPFGFGTRLLWAWNPRLRCEAVGHFWQHSDFIWVRRCEDCGKYENYRS